MTRDFAIVLILTLITTFAWIGFQETALFRKSPQDSFANRVVKPISPELRIDIAQEL